MSYARSSYKSYTKAITPNLGISELSSSDL